MESQIPTLLTESQLLLLRPHSFRTVATLPPQSQWRRRQSLPPYAAAPSASEFLNIRDLDIGANYCENYLMDYEINDDANGEVVGSSTNFEGRTDDDDTIVGSSADGMLQQGLDIKVDEDSSERDLFQLDDLQDINCATPIDEPYVGQEFESEAAAHAFYNSYATSVGFVIRVSKLSRSRRDGSAIGRALVCNKEGFRMPDKREKIVRQRVETRVGCRAMVLVRKISSGKWTVTKFVKDHTHPLSPGKGRKDLIYDQYPNEHDKIRELSQQLAIEKKKVAAYKRHLEMIFEHIEEHNQSLGKKIQNIMNSVRDMESKEHLDPRFC